MVPLEETLHSPDDTISTRLGDRVFWSLTIHHENGEIVQRMPHFTFQFDHGNKDAFCKIVGNYLLRAVSEIAKDSGITENNPSITTALTNIVLHALPSLHQLAHKENGSGFSFHSNPTMFATFSRTFDTCFTTPPHAGTLPGDDREYYSIYTRLPNDFFELLHRVLAEVHRYEPTIWTQILARQRALASPIPMDSILPLRSGTPLSDPRYNRSTSQVYSPSVTDPNPTSVHTSADSTGLTQMAEAKSTLCAWSVHDSFQEKQ